MNADLQKLGRRLVGRWTTEATHPGLPGAIVTGSSEIEWLEGEHFLIYRSGYDHPDIPDSISIIGDTEGLHMHYFDTRGVHRIFKVTATGNGWEMDGSALIRQLVRIARCAVLAAHDLYLRGRGPDDVREGYGGGLRVC